MIWDRASLKNLAKGRMRNNYGSCILAAFLLSLVIGLDVSATRQIEFWDGTHMNVSVNAVGFIISVFIGNVFLVGGCRFFLENRDYQAPLSKILFGFQNGFYGNVVWTMLGKSIKTLLWTMLFIIPGIVKHYEYRMIPYILAEQPDLPSREAFSISREMMRGAKMEAFILDVSFFGWWIFSAFTCGVGGICWTLPYIHATNAEFYAALRDSWMSRQHMGNPYEPDGETF